MQKKVLWYRQKVQIFKSTDGTGTKKYYRGTIELSIAHLLLNIFHIYRDV